MVVFVFTYDITTEYLIYRCEYLPICTYTRRHLNAYTFDDQAHFAACVCLDLFVIYVYIYALYIHVYTCTYVQYTYRFTYVNTHTYK